MNIVVNGKSRPISEAMTVEMLLKDSGFESSLVVVEVNQSIIPRMEYGICNLRENDTVEILRFVGGG
jgi:sulfur carrier protein